MSNVDHAAALTRLMRFLAVEGVTGKEAAIGRELATALKEVGVPGSAIYLDDATHASRCRPRPAT
jgi:tripeptide aminopeptidase